MSEVLKVRIEFPEGQARENLTPDVLANTVRATILQAGVDHDTVSASDVEVSLKKETSLGTIDPAMVTVLVAVFGMSIELVKLGIDLMKHDEQMALEKQKQEALQPGEDGEQEILKEFVREVLLERLREEHDIHPQSVLVYIEQR